MIYRIKHKLKEMHDGIKAGLKYHLEKNQGLLKHVIFMGIVTTIANLFAVAFNLYAARKLPTEEYGALVSLIAIIFIFSTTFAAVHVTITKFVSHYKVKSRFEEINVLMRKTFKFFFFVGLAIFLITLLLSTPLKEFLHLEAEMPIIILGLILWLIPLTAVVVGGLRGLQKFKLLGATTFIDGTARFFLGIVFIGLLGWVIVGGLSAIGIATLVSFAVGFIALFSMLSEHEYKVDMKEVWNYGWPVFIALISLAILSNTDIIIVRHFFRAKLAGQYAVASVIATLSFFTSNIFSLTMFPKVSELHSNGKDSSRLLRSNLFYMLIICGVMYFLFHFYAQGLIEFFFGKKYAVERVIEVVQALVPAYAFLALANIIVIYDIAIGKLWYLFLLIGFAVLQPMLIWLIHPDLFTVALIQVCTMLSLFYVLLVSTGRALIFHQ